MNESYRQAIGNVLQRKRCSQHISKRQLSLMTSVSRPTIRDIEAGAVTPTLDTLARMADGLGSSIVEVLTETEAELDCADCPPCAHGRVPASRSILYSLRRA